MRANPCAVNHSAHASRLDRSRTPPTRAWKCVPGLFGFGSLPRNQYGARRASSRAALALTAASHRSQSAPDRAQPTVSRTPELPTSGVISRYVSVTHQSQSQVSDSQVPHASFVTSRATRSSGSTVPRTVSWAVSDHSRMGSETAAACLALKRPSLPAARPQSARSAPGSALERFEGSC